MNAKPAYDDAAQENAHARACEVEDALKLLHGSYARVDARGRIARMFLTDPVLLAVEPAAALGMHIHDAVNPAILRTLAGRLETSVPPFNAEYHEVSATVDGVDRLFEMHISPLPDGETLFVIRDARDRQATRAMELRYQQQLQRLAAETERASERERRRLAERLHDDLGQMLAVARIRLAAVIGTPDGTPDGTAADELTGVLQFIDRAIAEARSLTKDLAPMVLYELGLGPGVRTLCESIKEQYGLVVHIDDQLPMDASFAEEVLILAYRGTQETLMNVVKHAGVLEAELKLTADADTLRITIRDRGRGADTRALIAPSSASESFGLFSVLERTQALGGDLDIRSEPGRGTIVVLTVPTHLHPQGQAAATP